jgi:hypothetical protein
VLDNSTDAQQIGAENPAGASWVKSWRSLSRVSDLIVRATAPVAAVDGQVFAPDSDVVRGIIRVWMPYTVRADSLHHALVIPPVQRPSPHVMVRRVVDAAVLSAALRFVVRFQ